MTVRGSCSVLFLVGFCWVFDGGTSRLAFGSSLPIRFLAPEKQAQTNRVEAARTNVPAIVAQAVFPEVAHSEAGAVAVDNGQIILVVWQEQLFPLLCSQVGCPELLLAARVRSSDGRLLDPFGIQLPNPYFGATPRIAALGDNFLVVWTDFKKELSPVGFPCNFHSDIFGARISSRDGFVLDPAGITISTTTNRQRSPAVAGLGDEYLVVWSDGRNDPRTGPYSPCGESDIYGARIRNSDGFLLDPNGIAICTVPNNQYSPSIAASANHYLVVWTDDRTSNPTGPDIFCARIRRSDGVVLDPGGVAVCTAANPQDHAAAIASGNDFFLLWQDYRNDPDGFSHWAQGYPSSEIFGTRVRGVCGQVLAPNGSPVLPNGN